MLLGSPHAPCWRSSAPTAAGVRYRPWPATHLPPGKALVALSDSGAIAVTDAAYQRGVQYLLANQLEDGSWFVRSRAIAFQPYFESGFPHGHDQWISAAATNWATMALIRAVR